MKTCTKCLNELPATLEYFAANKACHAGLNSTCRTCLSAYQRLYREKHRDRLKEEKRKWYQRANPKDRYRTAQHLAKELYPIRSRARIMRQGMRERAIAMRLPFDSEHFSIQCLIQMIQQTPNCPCCGKPIDYGYKEGKPKNASPSIDRIVGANGYVSTNVALICWRCNNLKRDATADELETVAKWMRSHTVTP